MFPMNGEKRHGVVVDEQVLPVHAPVGNAGFEGRERSKAGSVNLRDYTSEIASSCMAEAEFPQIVAGFTQWRGKPWTTHIAVP